MADTETELVLAEALLERVHQVKQLKTLLTIALVQIEEYSPNEWVMANIAGKSCAYNLEEVLGLVTRQCDARRLKEVLL